MPANQRPAAIDLSQSILILGFRFSSVRAQSWSVLELAGFIKRPKERPPFA
jgi:hypothetical protein